MNRKWLAVIPFLVSCGLTYYIVHDHAAESLKIQQDLSLISVEYEGKYGSLLNATEDYSWFILNTSNTVPILEKCKESGVAECANRIELMTKVEENHTALETLNLNYIKLEIGLLLGFGMFCSLLMFFAIPGLNRELSVDA
jgi:hypothetical protein